MGTSVEQFRAMALSAPGAVEGTHQGHADFRSEGRVFASLHPDGQQAMVRLPPGAQRRFLQEHGAACTAASGAWGRAGCTMLRLRAIAPEVVRDALGEAWQFAVASAAKARSKK